MSFRPWMICLGPLIQARIALGLSQKELAQRLGLKEQQVQRYEATDYATASLARPIKLSRALSLKVRAEAWAEGRSWLELRPVLEIHVLITCRDEQQAALVS